jgi:hypothetical protein
MPTHSRELLGLFRAEATYTVAQDLQFAHLTPNQLTQVGVALRKKRDPDYAPSHDPDKRAAEAFDELFNVNVYSKKGGTIGPDGPYEDSNGYAVAVGESKKITGELTLEDITTFLKEHQGPDDYLGLWRDSDGTLDLDTPVIVDTEKEALEVAVVNEQKAVWDFANDDEILTLDLQAELESTPPPPGARKRAHTAQKAHTKP